MTTFPSSTSTPSETAPLGTVLEGGRHCVLMLHGLGSTAVEFSLMAKALHAVGFSVHVPNLPGYCYGTEATAYSEWLGVSAEYLSDLQERYDSVSVVGISMGALLATCLAAQTFNNKSADAVGVAGAVLLAPSVAFDGWSLPWYRFLLAHVKWLTAFLPFIKRYKFVEREPFGVKNPEMRARMKRMLDNQSFSEVGTQSLPLQYLTEGRALCHYAFKQAKGIKVPTLLIHSVDDETVHIRSAERLFERIGTPDKEFVYLGDSYHMITVDNERDTVHQESIRFLKRCANEFSGTTAFEVPPLQSSELRRAWRNLNGGVHF